MAPVQILIVDDDDIDIRVMQRILADLPAAGSIHIAGDGREALEALQGSGTVSRIRPPCLVLLDIKTPRMSGLEFLREIRAIPALRTTVVMVLTTSDDHRDREAAYLHGAAAYLLKPRGRAEAERLGEFISHFIEVVVFPDDPDRNDAH